MPNQHHLRNPAHNLASLRRTTLGKEKQVNKKPKRKNKGKKEEERNEFDYHSPRYKTGLESTDQNGYRPVAITKEHQPCEPTGTKSLQRSRPPDEDEEKVISNP